jgi:hypothetical protein
LGEGHHDVHMTGITVPDTSNVGGGQIGSIPDGFGKLHNLTGSGSVVAGPRFLYAVVTDKWNDDSVVSTWGYTGLLVSRSLNLGGG